MPRFLIGLLLGVPVFGIAWAAGASPLWATGIGSAVAGAIWFGPRATG